MSVCAARPTHQVRRLHSSRSEFFGAMSRKIAKGPRECGSTLRACSLLTRIGSALRMMDVLSHVCGSRNGPGERREAVSAWAYLDSGSQKVQRECEKLYFHTSVTFERPSVPPQTQRERRPECKSVEFSEVRMAVQKFILLLCADRAN